MVYENELRKLQLVLTNILADVAEVCEENDIEYFIIAGTALGAVRHKGFIPWDDDIDIGMRRSEYERFVSLAPQKLPSHLFLQHSSTEPRAPFSYAKVRLNNSKYVEYCNRKVKMHQGIYLDVFPFDEVPEDEVKHKKQWDDVQKAVKKFAWRFVPDLAEKPSSVKDYVRWILKKTVYLLMKLKSKDNIVKLVRDAQARYEFRDEIAVEELLYPKYKRDYIKKTDLYPLVKYQFENIEVYGPHNMDAYLSTLYGDYMKLPPEDQRCGHRPYLFELPKELIREVK